MAFQPRFKIGDKVKHIGVRTLNRETDRGVGTIIGEGWVSILVNDYMYAVEFMSGIHHCYEHELKPLKKKLMVYYKEEVA